MSGPPPLDVTVRHRQGDFALDVSFRAVGGLTALVGRSGSGKTTLVNAVSGLLRPDRGRVALGDAVLLDTDSGIAVPPHWRRIGYVFQDARLFPHLTVKGNLGYGRLFAGRARAGDGALFDRTVATLGIAPLLGRRPAGLSGGEKQRVAIGRALLARPRLLLMDEPLASLDEARKAEIMPLIEAIRDEAGVPILYVSHNPAEIARLATNAVALADGRVLAAGPVERVLAATTGGEAGPTSVLAGRVAAHDRAFDLTRVETAFGSFHLPRIARPAGAPVRILVAARDVTLALERPAGISALNILPVTVERVEPGGGAWTDVGLRAGDGAAETVLTARITARSAAELAVRPGLSLHALVKATAIAGGGAPDP